MKLILGIVLGTLIAILVTSNARSLGNPSPPPGVSAMDWIPLGDAAGFVVVHDDASPNRINPAAGTVKGHFVVRRKDHWLRVDSTPDYGAQNAVMQR